MNRVKLAIKPRTVPSSSIRCREADFLLFGWTVVAEVEDFVGAIICNLPPSRVCVSRFYFHDCIIHSFNVAT